MTWAQRFRGPRVPTDRQRKRGASLFAVRKLGGKFVRGLVVFERFGDGRK